MAEEQKVARVSDMLRVTAQNTSTLLVQMAEHIDRLEAHIEKLERHILTLEGSEDGNRPTE
jgi:hypothetical protein